MGITLAPDPRLADAGSVEARVRDAALVCVARWGLGKTTLDDIARESGLSRATVYRAFPGGKDVLLDDVLQGEVSRFFHSLADDLDRADDLEDLLVLGLGSAMRFLLTHEALGTIVRQEPHLLLPQFAFHRLDPLLDAAGAFAVPYLRPHVADDLAARRAAELVVRIVLSYTLHPSAHLDPFDEASLRRFVAHHLLPGLSGADPKEPT